MPTPKKTFTAYVIDPFVLTVSDFGRPRLSRTEEAVRAVEIDGSLASIYAALSHEKHPVDCIDALRLPGSDVIYLDDEGLFKDHDHWFRLHGYHQPLRGRGLVVGTDRGGNAKAPDISIEQVRRNVQIGTDFFQCMVSAPPGARITPLLMPALRYWMAAPWGSPGVMQG